MPLRELSSRSSTLSAESSLHSAGDKYLMEDFYYVGGLLGLMSRLTGHLDLAQVTASGQTWGAGAARRHRLQRRRHPSARQPHLQGRRAGLLKGNFVPDGCVIKPSACDPRLLKHRGKALVFDSDEELKKTINRDDLDVTIDTVLVLRNAGPQGGPGMPVWGMLPIPTKLVKQGVRDMVRLSDARMSGASYGACILHVSPESYVGGPLALVKTGDIIALVVEARSITPYV